MEVQKRLCARESNEMIHAKAFESSLTENCKERKARAKRRLKRRLLVLLRDLDFYLDFCIARFILWRETRRK